MSIATAIQAAQQKVADAYTAASAKGATMPATQNLSNLATTIGSISGGGSSGKYKLFDRVSDDSLGEIGTVCGFFTDANDVEYAVVALDSTYRVNNVSYMGSGGTVSVPRYYQDVYAAKETATYNSDLLVADAAAAGVSCAATFCQSKVFTIDNVVYKGQLPNVVELLMIYQKVNELNEKDPTGSYYLVASCWSSNYNAGGGWWFDLNGAISPGKTTTSRKAYPVLEIPNA